MSDKVTSYHQARMIFKQTTGIEAAMEGGEDDEYFFVPPFDVTLQPIDNCAWANSNASTPHRLGLKASARTCTTATSNRSKMTLWMMGNGLIQF
ncbi:hypothetical protein [Bifidobacterium tissieri]|uniref:Uncharacterized protein n=1 Tax=Bifidobacterium tissieri TaxID=1630162 RepID=A0A5M9ZKH3_9BIFI|nr:hypothetical protein [Bifidobacterium tissieri]KAA8827382.1 hypothetical protein EMO89_10745 [Bifidobacterium tissieri]KAA8830560.1 hypothetical protein EM849_09765 [Bifidobacterium tissieri]